MLSKGGGLGWGEWFEDEDRDEDEHEHEHEGADVGMTGISDGIQFGEKLAQLTGHNNYCVHGENSGNA